MNKTISEEKKISDKKLKEKEATEKALLSHIKSLQISASSHNDYFVSTEEVPFSKSTSKIKICGDFQENSQEEIQLNSPPTRSKNPKADLHQECIRDSPLPAYIQCLDLDLENPVQKSPKKQYQNIKFEDQCQSTRTDENITISAQVADHSFREYKRKTKLGAYKENAVVKRKQKGKQLIHIKIYS